MKLLRSYTASTRKVYNSRSVTSASKVLQAFIKEQCAWLFTLSSKIIPCSCKLDIKYLCCRCCPVVYALGRGHIVRGHIVHGTYRSTHGTFAHGKKWKETVHTGRHLYVIISYSPLRKCVHSASDSFIYLSFNDRKSINGEPPVKRQFATYFFICHWSETLH